MSMEKICPFCDIIVDDHGIECEKCKKWVHYKCTLLPPYSIMLFSKSGRQYSCETCVLVRFSSKYPTLLTDIEKEIASHTTKVTPQHATPDPPCTSDAPAHPHHKH